MKNATITIVISYDPTNPRHTVSRFVRLLREQAYRIDHTPWNMSAGKPQKIEDMLDGEIVGSMVFNKGEP